MASMERAMTLAPLSAALAGSSETRATLLMEVTAQGPWRGRLVSGTMRVPGSEGAKLFLLQTGMRFSIKGASVRGCSTLAPL